MDKTLYRTGYQFWTALDNAIKVKKEIYVCADCTEPVADYCLEISENDVYNFHVTSDYNLYKLHKDILYSRHNGSYDSSMNAFLDWVIDIEFSADFSFLRLWIFFNE
jgi:hypothetical protein